MAAAFRDVRIHVAACLAAALAIGCASSADRLASRIDALLRRGLHDEALSAAEAALQQSPDDPRLLALVGQCHLAQGDQERARQSYGSACARDTSYCAAFARALLAQGAAWIASDDWTKGEWALRTAVEMEPESARAAARVCMLSGERLLRESPEGADRPLALAMALLPDMRADVGRLYLASGRAALNSDPSRAERRLQHALTCDPSLGPEIADLVRAAYAGASGAGGAALLGMADRLALDLGRNAAGARMTREVRLQARDGWVPTDCVLAPGDLVGFVADGTVRAEANHEGWVSEACGPAGWPSSRMEWLDVPLRTLPAPRAARMALVGRVGSSGPFPVGARLSYTAPAAGRLYVAVNEFPDRSARSDGAFLVRIEFPYSAYQSSSQASAQP